MTVAAPVYDEPALVCIYGCSGAGKTTDTIQSFPDALFIAAPGALAPWTWLGMPYKPASANAPTIMAATELIQKHAKGGKYSAIVCDDFSLLSDATFAVIEKDHSRREARVMWGAVRECLLAFRHAAREAGLHIVLTCHERGPHIHEKKGHVKGGPALPGTMPEDFPKSCDCVYRVQPEPSYPGWPMMYSAKPPDASDYVEKDRYNFVPPALRCGPMNLGELLRRGFGTEGRFGIRRPRGLEWLEEIVAKLAEKLVGDAATPGSDMQKAILRASEDVIRAKRTADTRLIDWIFRDAIARAWLCHAHAQQRSTYTR